VSKYSFVLTNTYYVLYTVIMQRDVTYRDLKHSHYYNNDHHENP